jgi:hypothetical protein
MYGPPTARDGFERLFRALTDEEEAEFRAYARTHPEPPACIWLACHPVCRDEWLTIRAERKETVNG